MKWTERLPQLLHQLERNEVASRDRDLALFELFRMADAADTLNVYATVGETPPEPILPFPIQKETPEHGK